MHLWGGTEWSRTFFSVDSRAGSWVGQGAVFSWKLLIFGAGFVPWNDSLCFGNVIADVGVIVCVGGVEGYFACQSVQKER